MINGEHTVRRPVAKLSDDEIALAKAYIQGAVYCFCKNCPDRSFSARELFGGENTDWSDTPLDSLYKWHKNSGNDKPVEMAGKDLGWILLQVIVDDKHRKFEIAEGYTHSYRWIRSQEDIT